MNTLFWTFFLVSIGILHFQVHAESDDELVTYVGAVLEYSPYDEWTDEGNGLEIITTNAKAIIQYAEQAKVQFADIFVSPEYGIQSLNMKRPNVSEFLTFTQYVPPPSDEIIPCGLPDDTSRIDAVRLLSCAADVLDMYLVIDLGEVSPCDDSIFDSEIIYWPKDEYSSCPPEGYYAYNTQVVFDRQGKVIARYRKQHLFLEDQFTPGTKDNSIATFVTDFNVLFSLQICFDIVFDSPGYYNVKYAGARDVVMGTAWVDELPFHLADNIQNAWSRGLDANLLVAGYHYPFKSKMGSGIYRGYAKDLPVYVYDYDSVNTLLVSTITTRSFTSISTGYSSQEVTLSNLTKLTIPVPKRVEGRAVYEGSNSIGGHTMLQLDMTPFNTVFLDSLPSGEEAHVKYCSEDFFCCDLSYEYSGSLSYAFTVFSGQITEGDGRYYIGLQTCGVVFCSNSTDVSSCGKKDNHFLESDEFGPFEISSSSFSAVDIYPMGLRRDYSLVNNDDLQFESGTTTHKLFTEIATSDLYSTGLYGRWYANDP